jgi:hypothetical protein
MSLRDDLAGDLPEGFEWGAADLALLEQAEGLLQSVAELEAAIAHEGVVVEGSRGQSRVNGAVAELRQARSAVARIVSLIAQTIERAESGSKYSSRAARRR